MAWKEASKVICGSDANLLHMLLPKMLLRYGLCRYPVPTEEAHNAVQTSWQDLTATCWPRGEGIMKWREEKKRVAVMKANISTRLSVSPRLITE